MPTRGWEGRLRLAAKAIDERLKADPMQSVVHGDPKDANFYFAADGTPQLYDFQYCGKACPAKDVAYCLCCGSSAWDEADELARGYHRDLSAALSSRGEEPPPVDAFLESLELALVHVRRCLGDVAEARGAHLTELVGVGDEELDEVCALALGLV